MLADRYRGLTGIRPMCVTFMSASVSYVCVSVCGGEGGSKGLIEQERCKYSGGNIECGRMTNARVRHQDVYYE